MTPGSIGWKERAGQPLPLGLSAARSRPHFRKSGQEVGSPLPMMWLPGLETGVWARGVGTNYTAPNARNQENCPPGPSAVSPPPQRDPQDLCTQGRRPHLPHGRPVNQGTRHYTLSSLRPGFWSCHFLHLLTYASSTDFFTFAERMQGKGRLLRSRAGGRRTHKTRRKLLAIQVILQTW